MNSRDHTTWFRKHAVAFAAGLLSPEDEDRFRRLLAEDSACAEAAEDLGISGAAPGEESAHIPPDTMARWDTVRQQARGLEREMLSRHLTDCSDCRRDLELLGYEPSLSEAPAPAVVSGAEARPSLAQRVLDWFSAPAGWGTAAAAAAVVLFLFFPRGDSPLVSLTTSPTGSTPSFALGEQVRSGDVPVFTVPPGTRQLAISLSGILAEESRASVSVQPILLDPEGRSHELARIDGPTLATAALLLGDGKNPVSPGQYTLELFIIAADGALTREYVFEVALDAAP